MSESNEMEPRSLLENPSVSLDDAIKAEIFGGMGSESGVVVNETNALKFVAVFACVRIIAETVASLPLNVYERDAGGRRLATDHPAYDLLHDSPNEWMTSLIFRETAMAHVLLKGNAYAAIGHSGENNPTELLPLNPSDVSPMIEDGRKVFRVRTNKGGVTLDDSQVLHIPGLGYDGLCGYSVLSYIANAIGLGIAAERYGAKVFKNDASAGAVVEVPAKLSDKAYDRLREQWRQRLSGGNAHSTAIMEEGAKLSRLGLPAQDALFLEGRKFQIEEIARFYRVPPHMLAMLDRSTNSNIEQQSLDFEKHTLRRWLVAWEQECNRKLFRKDDRRRYYVEHNLDGLLRGDIKTRYEAYAIGRNWGWLNDNDIREKENMSPIKGGGRYLVPANMIPIDRLDTQPPTNAAPASTAIDTNVPQRMKPFVVDAIERLMRRESDAVAKASKGDYAKEMSEFTADHVPFVTRAMTPICDVAGAELMKTVGEYMRIRDGFDPEASADTIADQLIRSL